MHLDQLIQTRGLSHQQQHPVRAAIERKHRALLDCGDPRLTGLDDFIFAEVAILNPGFLPTIDHRSQASLFIDQCS